jgi:hypothetical protein
LSCFFYRQPRHLRGKRLAPVRSSPARRRAHKRSPQTG